MTVTNQIRREIMLTAWELRRGEPSRDFADCLRGAWRFVRSMAAYAAKFVKRTRRAGRVSFSPSLISTPIGRATTAVIRPGRADWHAAKITSRVGW